MRSSGSFGGSGRPQRRIAPRSRRSSFCDQSSIVAPLPWRSFLRGDIDSRSIAMSSCDACPRITVIADTSRCSRFEISGTDGKTFAPSSPSAFGVVGVAVAVAVALPLAFAFAFALPPAFASAFALAFAFAFAFAFPFAFAFAFAAGVAEASAPSSSAFSSFLPFH